MKLTLLDFPGKVACTVFTEGCNLRCPFCHNASLVGGDTEEIGQDELFSFLKKRFGILDGICITGGEPTLYPDLPDFIRKVKAIGYKVKLDTNGTNPEMLKNIIDQKLIDYVAMDIKNSPSKYSFTCGIDTPIFEKVNQSIDILKSSDIPYEFRTTAVKELHTDEDFKEIGEWLKGTPKYFLQCFKDSGDILSEGMSAPPESDMRRYLNIVKKYIPSAKLRGIE